MGMKNIAPNYSVSRLPDFVGWARWYKEQTYFCCTCDVIRSSFKVEEKRGHIREEWENIQWAYIKQLLPIFTPGIQKHLNQFARGIEGYDSKS